MTTARRPAPSRAAARPPTAARTTPSPRNAANATLLLNASQLRSGGDRPPGRGARSRPRAGASRRRAAPPARPSRGGGDQPESDREEHRGEQHDGRAANRKHSLDAGPVSGERGPEERPSDEHGENDGDTSERPAGRLRRRIHGAPGYQRPHRFPASGEGYPVVRLTIRLPCTHADLTRSRKTRLTSQASGLARDTAHLVPIPSRPRTRCAARAGRERFVALAVPGPAMASACGDKVLADWFDNGRIDRLYQAHCYEEAIDAIPDDLEQYTDAQEVIGRALQASLRGELDPGGVDPTPGDDPRAGRGTPEIQAIRVTRAIRPTRIQAPRRRPTSTRPASRRFRSRSSCSVGCRSCCSRPAASATSLGAALRHATTGLPAPTTTCLI